MKSVILPTCSWVGGVARWPKKPCGQGNQSCKQWLDVLMTKRGKSDSRALIQTEHHTGQVRLSTAGQIGSLGGSFVRSTAWMVLHRPVELAALTGEVEFTAETPRAKGKKLGRPRVEGGRRRIGRLRA